MAKPSEPVKTKLELDKGDFLEDIWCWFDENDGLRNITDMTDQTDVELAMIYGGYAYEAYCNNMVTIRIPYELFSQNVRRKIAGDFVDYYADERKRLDRFIEKK